MIARNPITNKGKQILEHKLTWLKNEQEKTIEEIVEARKKGDLSENFEYHAAKRRNGELAREIENLSHYIRSSITPRISSSVTIVCFGTHVTLLNKSMGGKTFAYVIVGDQEAAPEKGSVSIRSALVQQLLGKSIGATFTLNEQTYEITHIRPASDDEFSEVILTDEWVGLIST